jgi:uncharacterized protein YukE
MSEQQVDLASLQQLVTQMESLVRYCDALRQGAGGFAYMLPAEWQGPAMTQFLASFEAWSVGAQGLTESAQGLHELAKAVHTAYSTTVENLDTAWSDTRASLA